MSTLISVNRLTKRYGAHRGIEDVTFEVAEGEVFGFLGPNGAGKTTTIRTLLGFLRPTSGSASIGGLDCWSQSPDIKRSLGYLPGEFTLDPRLTGAQILEYLAHLRGGVDQNYVKVLVERLELDPSRRFREYSRGNKQKVGLVQAFMHRPRLLMFDEPTAGLDPLNQQEFYRMLAEVKSEGRTAFLSSHNLTEVERTCDRVGIIRDGQLVKADSVETLRDIKHHEVEITFPGPVSATWFSHVEGVRGVEIGDGGNIARLRLQGELGPVIKVAAQHGATNLTAREPSLEEVFLRYYQPQSSAVPAGA